MAAGPVSVTTPGSDSGSTAGGAVSGGPIGVGGVNIFPVLPGPGGNSPGVFVGGPLVAIVVILKQYLTKNQNNPSALIYVARSVLS